MSKKLSVAVAGLGRIGWQAHCPELKKNKFYSLDAVCDSVRNRCNEAESTFKCKSYQSFDDMLKHDGLEVVVIATPTHLHKEHCIKAFKAGLHVILEKPMALNYKESQSIVRAAKRYSRLITVYQPHRVLSYYQQLKHILSKGQIGEIVEVRRGMFNYVQRNDWQSLKKYGGGMLMNYGAHCIDQLFDLTGSQIKKVFSKCSRILSLGDAEDYVKIVYETKNGIIADLEINQACNSPLYEIDVIGKLGTLRYASGVFTLKYVKGGVLPHKELNTSLASEGRVYPFDKIAMVEKTIKLSDKYSINFHSQFAKALHNKEPLLVPPEDTLAVMKFINSIGE